MRACGRFTASFDIADPDRTRAELVAEASQRAHLALKEAGVKAMWELSTCTFYPALRKLVLTVPTITKITEMKHVEC